MSGSPKVDRDTDLYVRAAMLLDVDPDSDWCSQASLGITNEQADWIAACTPGVVKDLLGDIAILSARLEAERDAATAAERARCLAIVMEKLDDVKRTHVAPNHDARIARAQTLRGAYERLLIDLDPPTLLPAEVLPEAMMMPGDD